MRAKTFPGDFGLQFHEIKGFLGRRRHRQDGASFDPCAVSASRIAADQCASLSQYLCLTHHIYYACLHFEKRVQRMEEAMEYIIYGGRGSEFEILFNRVNSNQYRLFRQKSSSK